MNKELLFRRGYVITEQSDTASPPSQIADWDTEVLCDFIIHSHPELTDTVLETTGYNLALLGTVVDPINEIASTAEIVERLIHNISVDMTDFYEYLDALSGRFVLFVEGETESFVLQDASGTRSLFYDTESSMCRLSSHPEILARMAGYDKSSLVDLISRAGVAAYPGLATAYTEIKRLTPNTLLRLPDNNVERFFPREPITERELTDELVDDVADILTTQLSLLNQKHELALSLSAGLDSRVSLAATKDISDEVEYYTFEFPDKGYTEADATRELCDELGIDLRVVDLYDEAPREFMDIFMQNTSNMSIPERGEGVYNHLNKFSRNRLELRSNVAEVARTFYRDYAMIPPNEISADTFQKLYFRAMSEQVLQEFSEFIDTTAFSDENIYNYDIYDLFYWEHRMGSWLAQWLLERDLSHDNFVVYNNRALLKKMLSVSMNHRLNNDFFYRLAEKMWPECLSVAINPHNSERSALSKASKRFAYGLALRTPLSIYKPIIRRIR